MNLSKYAIKDDGSWDQAEAEVAERLRKNGGKDLSGFNTTISVKGAKRAVEEAESSPRKAQRRRAKVQSRRSSVVDHHHHLYQYQQYQI